MLDWAITHKDTKHYVVIQTLVSSDMLSITITRTRIAGGRPLRIVKLVDITTTFQEGIRIVENIVKLEDDIYAMLAEHCDTLR